MPESLTEINQLKMYDTGDNPGAANLNSNLQAIDKKLLNSATTKPAAYPVGAYFLDSTEKILYQNTGTHDVPVWTVRLDGQGTPPTPATPKAATLVASPTTDVGDFTTIAASLAGLPAESGFILLREGTFAISAVNVLPDKSIVIKGCGRGNTIIDLGANNIAAFSSAFARKYVFRDLSVVGTAGQTQKFLSLTAAAEVLLENVDISGIQKIISTSSTPKVVLRNCVLSLPNQSDTSFWDGSSTGGSMVWDGVESTVALASAIAIQGQPDFTARISSLTGGSTLSAYDVGKIRFQGFVYDHATFTLNQANSSVSDAVGTDVRFVMKAMGLSITGSDFIGVADTGDLVGVSTVTGALNLRVSACTFDGGTVQRFLALADVTSVFITTVSFSSGAGSFMDLDTVTMSLTNCQYDASVPTLSGTDITLIGSPTYAFTKSGALTTGDLLTSPGKGQPVTRATASVEVAPSGDDLTVDILLIDRSDGSTVATVGTLTIADGDLEGSVFFDDPVDVPENYALKASVDIGGSTGASDLVMLVS